MPSGCTKSSANFRVDRYSRRNANNPTKPGGRYAPFAQALHTTYWLRRPGFYEIQLNRISAFASPIPNRLMRTDGLRLAQMVHLARHGRPYFSAVLLVVGVLTVVRAAAVR